MKASFANIDVINGWLVIDFSGDEAEIKELNVDTESARGSVIFKPNDTIVKPLKPIEGDLIVSHPFKAEHEWTKIGRAHV